MQEPTEKLLIGFNVSRKNEYCESVKGLLLARIPFVLAPSLCILLSCITITGKQTHPLFPDSISLSVMVEVSVSRVHTHTVS